MTGYPNEDEGPDEVKWDEGNTSEEKPGHTLMPCPFCGGTVQFRKALFVSDGNVDEIIHASSNPCGMVCFEDGSIDESILVKWNTRSVNAVPDLVKALEEARDLLLEVKQGSHARSPNHNARLVIDAALAKVKP